VSQLSKALKPPRINQHLATAVDWSLSREPVVSDILLHGDFALQQHEDLVFERCRISNVAFTGSQLRRLRFTDVVVENTDLSGADLDESSFNRVEFVNCRLSGTIMTRCKLTDVRVGDCRLDQINLRMSEGSSILFEDVDLKEADFYAISLANTSFFNCDLTDSEFSKATMTDVRFQGSDLGGLRGGQYLAGSTIGTEQVLPLALGVFSALDIQISDNRETGI
jgi:uncharacterized protein YjbI with pentapeptide repeats